MRATKKKRGQSQTSPQRSQGSMIVSSRRNRWIVRVAAAGVFCVLATCGRAQETSNVELVGQIGGVCKDVHVAGNNAYISQGPSLEILDISAPSSPVLLGRVVLPSLIAGISVS